jgi:hypothetical protein
MDFKVSVLCKKVSDDFCVANVRDYDRVIVFSGIAAHEIGQQIAEQ